MKGIGIELLASITVAILLLYCGCMLLRWIEQRAYLGRVERGRVWPG